MEKLFETKAKGETLNEELELNELFLPENQEREIRTKIGKYTIYEPNAEFYKIINEMTALNKSEPNENGEISEVNISESDSIKTLVRIMVELTDLPESIASEETLKRMDSLKRKPSKLLTSIISEIGDMIYEAYESAIKVASREDKITKNMSPKAKAKYLELRNKILEKAVEVEPELTDEEKEEIELEKRLEEIRVKKLSK